MNPWSHSEGIGSKPWSQREPRYPANTARSHATLGRFPCRRNRFASYSGIVESGEGEPDQGLTQDTR
jgi:hypothetical protein